MMKWLLFTLLAELEASNLPLPTRHPLKVTEYLDADGKWVDVESFGYRSSGAAQVALKGSKDKANAEEVELTFRALLGHPQGKVVYRSSFRYATPYNPCSTFFGVQGCVDNEPSLSFQADKIHQRRLSFAEPINPKPLTQSYKMSSDDLRGLLVFKGARIVNKDAATIEVISFSKGFGPYVVSKSNETGITKVQISSTKETTLKSGKAASFKLIFEISELPSTSKHGGVVTPTAMKVTVETSCPLASMTDNVELDIEMLGAAGLRNGTKAKLENKDQKQEAVLMLNDLLMSWDLTAFDKAQSRNLELIYSKQVDHSSKLPMTNDGTKFHFKTSFAFHQGSSDSVWGTKLGLDYEATKAEAQKSALPKLNQNRSELNADISGARSSFASLLMIMLLGLSLRA